MYFVLEGHRDTFPERCCLAITLPERYPWWPSLVIPPQTPKLSTVLRHRSTPRYRDPVFPRRGIEWRRAIRIWTRPAAVTGSGDCCQVFGPVGQRATEAPAGGPFTDALPEALPMARRRPLGTSADLRGGPGAPVIPRVRETDLATGLFGVCRRQTPASNTYTVL